MGWVICISYCHCGLGLGKSVMDDMQQQWKKKEKKHFREMNTVELNLEDYKRMGLKLLQVVNG